MILHITYEDNELPINSFRWTPSFELETQKITIKVLRWDYVFQEAGSSILATPFIP